MFIAYSTTWIRKRKKYKQYSYTVRHIEKRICIYVYILLK